LYYFYFGITTIEFTNEWRLNSLVRLHSTVWRMYYFSLMPQKRSTSDGFPRDAARPLGVQTPMRCLVISQRENHPHDVIIAKHWYTFLPVNVTRFLRGETKTILIRKMNKNGTSMKNPSYRLPIFSGRLNWNVPMETEFFSDSRCWLKRAFSEKNWWKKSFSDKKLWKINVSYWQFTK